MLLLDTLATDQPYHQNKCWKCTFLQNMNMLKLFFENQVVKIKKRPCFGLKDLLIILQCEHDFDTFFFFKCQLDI